MKRSNLLAGAVVLVLSIWVVTRVPSFGNDEFGAFRADPADCIAGVDQPRHLVNPARIDHPLVLERSAPMREMQRKRIAPDSAQGIILRAEGEALVAGACTVTMRKLGYDSIWKRITRRDGQAIPDVTREVLARMASEEPVPPSMAPASHP